MGTRSLTHIKEDGTTLVTIYRQMDGYPKGHGIDIAEFLKDINLVNGIGLADKRIIANGMGCLTAQIIAHLKHGVGSIYVYPPNSKNCGEEYIYTIYNKDGKIRMKCDNDDGKCLFDGTAEEFIANIKNIEAAVDA